MNSLGARSDRNISIKYRSCHPSFLGRLDLNTCSSSSPGLSGCVSPFAKTDKLWFNAEKEAENMEYDIYKASMDYANEHSDGECHIGINYETPEEYFQSKYNVYSNYRNFHVEFANQEIDDTIPENGVIEEL